MSEFEARSPLYRTDKERFTDLVWLTKVIERAESRLTTKEFDAAAIDPVDRHRIKTALANAASCIHAVKLRRQ